MAVHRFELGNLVRRVAVVAFLGLALTVSPAALVARAAQPVPAGQRADFNGDGFDDLAVGAAFEDLGGVLDAGAVNVLYGSAAGLAGGQLFPQDTPGIPGVAEADDLFGGALAADR